MQQLTYRVTHRHAFTLIETIVALAVIALLVGSVVVGQRVLRQSQLQAVLSDYAKYSSAVNQFRQQYNGFPGDLLDAQDFWGSNATYCTSSNNLTPGTCNGNGNGQISGTTEPYRAWEQLVDAKYIEGSYSGVGTSDGSGNILATPGTNVPRARLANSGWSFGYKPTTSSDNQRYDQGLDNFLAFGAATTATSATNATDGYVTIGPVLTPEEAMQLDKKIDDGLPTTGRVVSLRPSWTAPAVSPVPNCVNVNAYKIAYKAEACSLNMKIVLQR